MFALARQAPGSVTATTTHLAAWQTALADVHVPWALGGPFPGFGDLSGRLPLITGPFDPSVARMRGLSLAQMDALRTWAEREGRMLFVEADGSRQRPLKAPAAHEPAMPDMVGTVIVAAGLNGLEQPLDETHVHRAHIFSALSGCPLGDPITPHALVSVLSHPDGGLRHIPGGARRVALLTHADTPERVTLGNRLARDLLTAFRTVIVASQPHIGEGAVLPPRVIASPSAAAVHERVGGVLLAAGGSSRYGRPKQLLDFEGRPLVRIAAEAGLAAGLHPLVVVTGAAAEQVGRALGGLAVVLAHNPDWPAGQAISLRTGLSALADAVDAAVFLLADQPHVSASTIRALVDRHAEGLQPIVAPEVAGRRATPVLFDRCTFGDLGALTGDVGGRALFSRYRVESVACDDRRLLVDIDTQEEYGVLLGIRS
jgi:molybdenum cofactor cytidylyltransferase